MKHWKRQYLMNWTAENHKRFLQTLRMLCSIASKTGKCSKNPPVLLPVDAKDLRMVFVQVLSTSEDFSQFK